MYTRDPKAEARLLDALGQIRPEDTVDPDRLAAGNGGGGLVAAGEIQLRAVGNIGAAGEDAHGAGGLIPAHGELGRCAVEQIGQVPELEVVAAVDVVLFAGDALAVHGELLRREHGGGCRGKDGQSGAQQNKAEQQREKGFRTAFHCVSSFVLYFTVFMCAAVFIIRYGAPAAQGKTA